MDKAMMSTNGRRLAVGFAAEATGEVAEFMRKAARFQSQGWCAPIVDPTHHNAKHPRDSHLVGPLIGVWHF
jgi:hypothetical protein